MLECFQTSGSVVVRPSRRETRPTREIGGCWSGSRGQKVLLYVHDLDESPIRKISGY